MVSHKQDNEITQKTSTKENIKMAHSLELNFKDSIIHAVKFSEEDEKNIIEPFLFWKTQAFLAEHTDIRNAPLPEGFTEKLCCYVCNLAWKKGAGPDAFEVSPNNEILSVIEIKATVTPQGFQEIKNYDFDYIYWFDFSQHKDMKFQICKLPRRAIFGGSVDKTKKKLSLKNYLEHGTVIHKGRIGVISY